MDLHVNHLNGRFEQILAQFLLKSLHIVLDSRVPSLHSHPVSGGEVKKTDKWFNLVLGDWPPALDNLNFWHRNLMDPLVIDIILTQDKLNSSSSSTTSTLGTLTETVIERWVIRYEGIRKLVPQGNDASYKKTYKDAIPLLRSLYFMMRLLPGYKAFGKLSSSYQTREFDIIYKVSVFSAPLSRAEEASMKQYSFVPVEAHQGRLSISVSYRQDLSNFNLETPASFPAEIITDYVGSPLADPLRAFPASYRGTSLLSRGMQSPSSGASQRPHSWTSGVHHRLSSPQPQPFAASPPVFYPPYDYSSAPSDMYGGQRMQNYKSPTHRKSASGDDYQLSPPFSSSPSQSPPTYLSRGNSLQARLQSETAPVSIPYSLAGRSLKNISPNLSDPNKHSLPPMSPKFTKHDSSSQESPSGIRSYKRPDSLRSGESGYGITNMGPKIARDTKDDSGRSSGLLSSSDSPRVGFSRSSSRLSFQDDLDECDFACPFVVDDVDSSYSPARQDPDSIKGSEASLQALSVGRKQDAAVGALVYLLKTAPPLRQDSGGYTSELMKSQVEGGSGASSGFSISRKTSDALEELKGYKKLKESLLAKSTRQEVSEGEAPVH